MDLALNNLQRLICHKTQETNQQINTDVSFFAFNISRIKSQFKKNMKWKTRLK